MKKFESHITYSREHLTRAAKIGQAHGWKWSAIDPDPIMSDKSYAYLTAYSTDPHKLRLEMDNVCALLETADIPVLRRKIEEIVFDTKTGVDALTRA